MQLAKLIDIECMEVEIGKYNNRVGSLSYRINDDDESLIEGIQLINKYYPNYNPETLNTKSTSRIRIDKYIKKEPTQLNVLKFMREYYYEDIIEIVNRITNNITEKNIDNILRECIGLISEKRIILIKKFLIGKIILLREEFKI